MSGPKVPDAIDQAIAEADKRNPLQEAVQAALPGGPGIGAGFIMRWTDGPETHEGAVAVFLPKGITWEAAVNAMQALDTIIANAARAAESQKPAAGLTLVRGTLPRPPS